MIGRIWGGPCVLLGRANVLPGGASAEAREGCRLRRETSKLLHLCALASFVAVGCHARPDDPVGQAKELKDPVRRENAISNLTRLYTKALAAHGGRRDAPAVKAIADASHARLVEAYVSNDEVRTGQYILDLLAEMRDARTLPALVKALDWRTEVNEEHTIRACRTIRQLDLQDGRTTKVVEAIGKAVGKVQGARAVDNRIRVECIRALGALGDRSATPILTKIATSQRREQSFLINRLAVEQLGRLEDPRAVPILIKSLFVYSHQNPTQRMNDVAAEALVRIGRASVKPLIDVMEGRNSKVNAIAQAYINTLKAKQPSAAEGMDVATLTSTEAIYTLGQLGVAEAYKPLIEQLSASSSSRRDAAALALVWLSWGVDDRGPIRSALVKLYRDRRKAERPALLSTMQRIFDAETLPFLLEEASRNEAEVPDIRFSAAHAYALLANKEEADALRPILTAKPQGEAADYRKSFEKYLPLLSLASACDSKLSCWLGKLKSDDSQSVRKAAYMAVRFGRGKPEVVQALVEALRSSASSARADLLYALDQAATKGSAEAVAAIEELSEREEGSARWSQVKPLAMAVQARLESRKS